MRLPRNAAMRTDGRILLSWLLLRVCVLVDEYLLGREGPTQPARPLAEGARAPTHVACCALDAALPRHALDAPASAERVRGAPGGHSAGRPGGRRRLGVAADPGVVRHVGRGGGHRERSLIQARDHAPAEGGVGVAVALTALQGLLHLQRAHAPHLRRLVRRRAPVEHPLRDPEHRAVLRPDRVCQAAADLLEGPVEALPFGLQ
mmetsp:Transcript_11549/g.24189  ORF Transcript_11549/g.24189 Transcript_11549/m.24189 type:complete len:204 (+) Transcript_11549:333-944(+)